MTPTIASQIRFSWLLTAASLAVGIGAGFLFWLAISTGHWILVVSNCAVAAANIALVVWQSKIRRTLRLIRDRRSAA